LLAETLEQVHRLNRPITSPLAIFCIYRWRRYISNIGIGDTSAASTMDQILSVPSQVGLVLRAARKSAGLSQKQLAARLGLSQNRMSELETDPGSMRVDQLLAVMAVLGIELQVQTRGGPPAASGQGRVGLPTVGKVEW
jgi:HTH-type transcriptional regulator / antitoxin HipB